MAASWFAHVHSFLYVIRLGCIRFGACLIGNELIPRKALSTIEAVPVSNAIVYIIDAVGSEQVGARWTGYASTGINLETAEGLGLNEAKTEQPDGALDK